MCFSFFLKSNAKIHESCVEEQTLCLNIINSDGQHCRHGGVSSPMTGVVAQNKGKKLKTLLQFHHYTTLHYTPAQHSAGRGRTFRNTQPDGNLSTPFFVPLGGTDGKIQCVAQDRGAVQSSQLALSCLAKHRNSQPAACSSVNHLLCGMPTLTKHSHMNA